MTRDEKEEEPPETEKMSRDGSIVNPVKILSKLPAENLRSIREMDNQELQSYFRSLGLRELPAKIEKNQLNGSVLHMVVERDIEKMDFNNLDEAKALLLLSKRIFEASQGEATKELLLSKEIAFDGKVVEWHPGPCSIFNCCALKRKLDMWNRIYDFLCCSPTRGFIRLPRSTANIYKDHMTIVKPKWLDEYTVNGEAYNSRFVPVNVASYIMHVDKIDYSLVTDVNLVEVSRAENHENETANCCKILQREPHEGRFYQIGPLERCFGYNHMYNQRPAGRITLTMRDTADPIVFGPLENTHEIAAAIQNYAKETRT